MVNTLSPLFNAKPLPRTRITDLQATADGLYYLASQLNP